MCYIWGLKSMIFFFFFPSLPSSLKETLLTDYLNNKNVNDAVSAVKEMKAPKHFLSEMLNKIIVCSLNRSDEDKEHASTLIHTLCTEGLVTGDNILQASFIKVFFFFLN